MRREALLEAFSAFFVLLQGSVSCEAGLEAFGWLVRECEFDESRRRMALEKGAGRDDSEGLASERDLVRFVTVDRQTDRWLDSWIFIIFAGRAISRSPRSLQCVQCTCEPRSGTSEKCHSWVKLGGTCL